MWDGSGAAGRSGSLEISIMRRLPLSDQLPYRFCAPNSRPFWYRATRGLRRRMLRGEHWIEAIEVDGVESLAALLERGDRVLLTPNHCDHADGLLMLDLADRLKRPICAMCTHQIFHGNAGLRYHLLPRLGLFPVDREGADSAPFKAGIEVLVRGEHSLLIFPEGEIYFLADRLTALREGPATMAVKAAGRLADSGAMLWVVPIGLKYRFVNGYDPIPAFHERMATLESRLTWRPQTDRPLVERIYQYGGGLLSLKEMEYLGQARSGSFPQRLAHLRDYILESLEDRHHGTHRAQATVPERVKELRRSIIAQLLKRTATPEQQRQLRFDLDDLFLVLQIYSYPGDYIMECPTLERVGETLMKLDEDLLGVDLARPLGPRRALVRVGEPIEVGAFLASARRSRDAANALSNAMHAGIQATLDAMGPGRMIDEGLIREEIGST
ncbi:hypothetical protein BH23PLA1_BH23PLA1_44880 [soil metagenome]